MQLWRRGWPIATLWGAVLLAYSNVYDNSFLYDDEFLIQKNTFIRAWSGIWKSFLMSSTAGSGGRDSFYRPMQGALYTVTYQIFGLSTFGFHLLNVLLHGLAATAVYLLARKLSFSRTAAWLGALLWCLHPLHTEAVTYQSATADTLYTLLVLCGLITLVPEFKMRSMLPAGFIFLAALGSKESAIVFPVLVMVCLFFLKTERWSPKTYLCTWPLWAIAVVYLVARKTILDFDHSFDFYKTSNVYTESILNRTYTFWATLPSYSADLIWPHHQHMDHSFPVFTSFTYAPVLLGAAMFALALFGIARARKQARPVLAFALLWFLAGHIPHMGVLLPVNAIFLEHWLYLPSIGFFMALGVWLTESPLAISFPRPVYALAGVAALALGIKTFMQNKIWESPITFYTNILQYEAKVARAHNNLAMALTDQGSWDAAIVEYRNAIAISDEYAQTHHNLGLALVNTGHVTEGIQQLERALQMNPEFYQSASALAEIYTKLGDAERAKNYQQLYAQIVQRFIH